MEIPKKFEINTEDFKVYFDNDKKTHVCENLETGEKTNIGFFGILLQMGIIKVIDEKKDDTMKNISEKLESLEAKIENLAGRIDGSLVEPESGQEPESISEEPENTQQEVESPKSDINERIMKNVLKQPENPVKGGPVEEKTSEEIPEPDVVVESKEEIENWEDI